MSKFRIEKLEDRIVPGAMAAACGCGNDGPGRSGHGNGGGKSGHGNGGGKSGHGNGGGKSGHGNGGGKSGHGSVKCR